MRVTGADFDAAALRRELAHPSCGGFCAFEGWVRDSNAGAPVDGLDYEAYAELAVAEGERVIAEALEKFDIVDARCVHRVGSLVIGDLAIWIGVAAPHRDAAFRACRYIIDEAKKRLPVWKKEHYVSGAATWVMPAQEETAMSVPAAAARTDADDFGRDGMAGDDRNDHDDAVRSGRPAALMPDAPAPFVPDYSRQMRLAGFGPTGQSKLAASRVLVIGAGGLGVPALSYLAGAGVGTIGIVDGDRLDASNLHRQVMYSAAGVGGWKVDLAARRLRDINPSLQVEVFRGVLTAETINAVFDRYDIVLECTDDIRSKYLCSDAAVATRTPIVFASIYQYEGQLHAWSPDSRAPCMRCLWPTPPAPGAIETCERAGVLGPVPGVLGAMQAIEAIKRIVGLPGAIQDAILLVNLMDYGIRSIAAGKTGACFEAGRCIVPEAIVTSGSNDELELRFDTVTEAIASGLILIDIRQPEEIAATPINGPSRWVPMMQLLADGTALRGSPDGDSDSAGYLVVCARGSRSAHVVAHLRRQHGIANAWSLAGGLAAFR